MNLILNTDTKKDWHSVGLYIVFDIGLTRVFGCKSFNQTIVSMFEKCDPVHLWNDISVVDFSLGYSKSFFLYISELTGHEQKQKSGKRLQTPAEKQ